MARPKKPNHEKATKQVNFRLTEVEYNELKAYQKNNNIGLREIMVSGFKKHYKPTVAKVDQGLIIQLSRIGNNINQLTKKVHDIYKYDKNEVLEDIECYLLLVRGILMDIRSRLL